MTAYLKGCLGKKISSAVCSAIFSEQDIIQSVVEKLGGFQSENTVNEDTTHVVCGGNRRTINILLAIARGCWLVSMEWVLKSLEAEKWLEEAAFERSDFFPAAKASRMERERAGTGYQQDLFSAIGLIYVSQNTAPPHSNLVNLIQLCGGQVTHCARKAKLSVGKVHKTDAVNVQEKWVLDSITAHKCLPYELYKIGKQGKPK